ncbi:hypothetical protein [Luteococcus peritonei]|uniref:Uncharacterized protein n=1 Tax=Luteococcus peritonei TaxID=88874 RepID=A0ABW4RTT2_9ACTN
MPKPLQLACCAMALAGGVLLATSNQALPGAAAADPALRPAVQVPTTAGLPTARPLPTATVPGQARAGSVCRAGQQGLEIDGISCIATATGLRWTAATR